MRFNVPTNPANVRQILGRPGEFWGLTRQPDQLVVVRPAFNR